MTNLDTSAGAAQRVLTSLTDIRHKVDRHVSDLFETRLREDADIVPHTAFGLIQLRDVVLSGGKRIRPAFTHWAFVAAGGYPDDEQAIRAGAVFELLHTFALVHDDVMDESDTRRSLPTLHVTFARRHTALGMHGSAQRYGENMAILLGDYMLIMCAQLVGSLPPQAVRAFYRAANQLMHGQYLDLETSATGEQDTVPAATTALLKTASYTVEGPLQVGAALTPRGPELESCLRVYGRAVGQAFQHRDDLLDLFGDETRTGKPVGGDLAQHKATRLLEIARRRATGADQALIHELDDGMGLEAVRSLFLRCGAVAELELAIKELILEATTTIADAPMSELGRDMLIDAAYFVGERKW